MSHPTLKTRAHFSNQLPYFPKVKQTSLIISLNLLLTSPEAPPSWSATARASSKESKQQDQEAASKMAAALQQGCDPRAHRPPHRWASHCSAAKERQPCCLGAPRNFCQHASALGLARNLPQQLLTGCCCQPQGRANKHQAKPSQVDLCQAKRHLSSTAGFQ